MRVVFDTNILVLSQMGDPGTAIMRAALEPRLPEPLDVYYSDATQREYRHVPARLSAKNPEVFYPEEILRFLALVEQRGHRISSTPTLDACSHEPDNRFLECAVAAQAEYLVTVNIQHFPAEYRGVRTVLPYQFYALLFIRES